MTPKLAASLYCVVEIGCGGAATRAMRMLEGKVEVVGVEGRTLTEVCGERVDLTLIAEELTEFELEEVEEVFEWVCT